jgi:hypothetical protein
MDRRPGAPVRRRNINAQPSLSSMFPALPQSNYGYGTGRGTPLDPFGGRNQERYVTPNVSDEVKRAMMGFVPVAGTVYNWNQMGPVERGFSVGMDAIDIATLGGSKGITAALRAAPNPLDVLRHVPGSSYGEPSTFIRTGLPPGSPHYPLTTRRAGTPPTGVPWLDEVLPSYNYDLPIHPPKFKPLDIPKGGLDPSVNWGTPGGYPVEAGISSYQVLPMPHLQAQYGRNLPLSVQQAQEELGQGLPMYYVRNPAEQGIPTSAVNRPVMRGDLDITSGRYKVAQDLQKDTLGWDESLGITDMGAKISPSPYMDLQKGMYMIEGHPVPRLGADFETLVNPQRITQYHRTDPSNFQMLNPKQSKEVFKNYDIYGRPRVPGGLHPFGGMIDIPSVSSLPFTTAGRGIINTQNESLPSNWLQEEDFAGGI